MTFIITYVMPGCIYSTTLTDATREDLTKALERAWCKKYLCQVTTVRYKLVDWQPIPAILAG